MKKLSAVVVALLLAVLAVPLAATAEAWPTEPAAADVGVTGPGEGLVPLANSASDFSYKVTNGTATITGYTGTAQNVVIPETIGGYPVTAIGDKAFYARNNLTGITLPGNVTSIGAYAFYGCNGAQFITIPDRVTSIGEGAFFLCSGLSSITIPETVTSIGADAFRSCGYLQTIEYNAADVKTSSIAFEDAGWDLGVSVIFGETVKQIPANLFYGCTQLTSVTIPDSVTSIGEYAFCGCSKLTTAAIPGSVTNLGSYAFSGAGLTTVTLTAGVTTIREGTFDGCESLTTVTIPAGVTSLGDNAFSSCSSLTTVTIPTSVTSIGAYAFYACGRLKSVTIPKNVTNIGNNAFDSCWGLTEIVYNAASVPDLTYWGVFGRAGSESGQTRVKIGTAVERIPAYLFSGCSGLTTVTIPSNVTEIGDHAFFNCSNLTAVSLPESVTSLKEGVFSGCTALQTIAIPESVKTIGEYAFDGCYELGSVTIQKGVRKIGQHAFGQCFSLAEVYYNGRETEWLRVSVGDGNSYLLSADFHFAEIPPEITAQPTDENAPDGSTAVFTVKAEGTHLTYRWQYSENGGETWINCDPSEGVTASFSFTVSEALHGRLYRCVVTDDYGTVTTDAAKLTVLGMEGMPAFKSQSLVLSGEIGVNFYMDLSQLLNETRSASCVEFTVGKGSPVTVPFDANKTNSKGYFGFTCYVKSIEMADTIKAVYHYGNGKTVSKEYSVLRYIQAVDMNASSYDAETLALVHSIADYGHYAQLYLAEVNGWTVGDKYAEMTLFYADSYDYADILSRVQANAFVKSIEGSNVTKATYKLHLDSDTILDVLLTTSDGAAPTDVKVTTYDEESGRETTVKVTPVLDDQGRYMIRITGISAHKLGNMMTISGTAGTMFAVKVSPLSFVRSILDKAAQPDEAKDCVSSLYMYYTATMAYRGRE